MDRRNFLKALAGATASEALRGQSQTQEVPEQRWQNKKAVFETKLEESGKVNNLWQNCLVKILLKGYVISIVARG